MSFRFIAVDFLKFVILIESWFV